MRIFPARSGSNSINSSGKQFRTKSTTKILPQLTESFSSVIGKTRWNLQASAEVSEAMTLLFSCPNAFEYTAYLRPQIKIEFGRGDQWPSKPFAVAPYVAEEFADIFAIPNVAVPVLDCQRTFWEKVTLIHAENHRPDPTTDVAALSATGISRERGDGPHSPVAPNFDEHLE
jgi:hypothetical protein